MSGEALIAALEELGLSPSVRDEFMKNNSAGKSMAVQLKWLQTLNKVVESVIVKMKRNEISGSGLCAVQTCELLRTVVSRGKFTNTTMLLSVLKCIGSRLVKARPTELAIGNMVRRVLFMVRNEIFLQMKSQDSSSSLAEPNENDLSDSDVGDSDSVFDGIDRKRSMVDGMPTVAPTLKPQESVMSASLANLLDKPQHTVASDTNVLAKIKPIVIEEICDLIDEIKGVSHSICDQAEDHIHAKEVIMTFGLSKTVVAFLAAAREFRQFEVIIAQSAPGYEGSRQAVSLANAGIECTVIPDSAVFAVMAHVSKVIIGSHAVLANGGLLAFTGAYNIMLAAKTHAVPTLVLTGLHKLSPLYAFDEDTFNLQNPPSQIINFDQHDFSKNVSIQNPAFDYVPAELITLFVTNNGGHSPFYIYRLLSEYYAPQDYDLSSKE